MKKILLTSCFILLFGLNSLATESPALSLGKTLFESTQLGTTGKSCATCHPQGEGLELVGDFNDMELKDIINACLRDALRTEKISTESQEMEALMSYVRTFEKKG